MPAAVRETRRREREGGGGEGAERYLGGGQAEARGRNGVWIRSGAGCLEERGKVWCMDGQVSLEACPVRHNGGKGQRDKKRWDQNSKGTKRRGFLGAQQAAGDEKTGARGRSAREAH